MIDTADTANKVESVLAFWFEESKPAQWYRRDAAFDQEIEKRFGGLHEAARNNRLDDWQTQPRSALARIIILDQFSRNIFRDSPKAYAFDDMALAASRDAISRDLDTQFSAKQQAFFLMPFMHAENLSVQKESVRHFKTRMSGGDNLKHAIEHHDIIARFGRFPHRNKVLGRASTPEEIDYLNAGGFNP